MHPSIYNINADGSKTLLRLLANVRGSLAQ